MDYGESRRINSNYHMEEVQLLLTVRCLAAKIGIFESPKHHMGCPDIRTIRVVLDFFKFTENQNLL